VFKLLLVHVVFLFCAVVAEMLLVSFFDWSFPLVMLLLPMLLGVAAVSRYSLGLLLAGIAGVFWDAGVALYFNEPDLLIVGDQKISPVESLAWGYHMFLFGFIVFIQNHLRGVYVRGYLWQPVLLNFCLLFVYLFIEYGVLSFVRLSGELDVVLVCQFVLTSVFSALLSWGMLVCVYISADWLGCELANPFCESLSRAQNSVNKGS